MREHDVITHFRTKLKQNINESWFRDKLKKTVTLYRIFSEFHLIFEAPLDGYCLAVVGLVSRRWAPRIRDSTSRYGEYLPLGLKPFRFVWNWMCKRVTSTARNYIDLYSSITIFVCNSLISNCNHCILTS